MVNRLIFVFCRFLYKSQTLIYCLGRLPVLMVLEENFDKAMQVYTNDFEVKR